MIGKRKFLALQDEKGASQNNMIRGWGRKRSGKGVGNIRGNLSLEK